MTTRDAEPTAAIPETVLDALEEIRSGGETNMLARNTVMRLISDTETYPEAVVWLYDNDNRYMEALTVMGKRRR